MSAPIAPMIGWQAGSSAAVEVFSPMTGSGANVYQFKYTPPFRTTIRPAVSNLLLGPKELDPLKDALNALATAVRTARGPGAPTAAADGLLGSAQEVGQMLFQLVIPRDVQADLRTENVFLEIGADEALLQYPWELLHDGDDFFCLKHLVGRFVNLTQGGPVMLQRRANQWSEDALEILIISVPRPQPRGARQYDPLVGAENETTAIVDALLPLGNAVRVSVLRGADATFGAVWNAIKTGRYHIVHFNGHAYFSDEPYSSSIVLWDKDMSTGVLRMFFSNNPPVLFFMNACETAATATAGSEWKDSYEIYGLARGFLDTGAYLLGSRWKIEDAGALIFAKSFYAGVVNGSPLGVAIRDARKACKAAMPPGDMAWASYLFYGDPRLYFRKSTPDAPP